MSSGASELALLPPPPLQEPGKATAPTHSGHGSLEATGGADGRAFKAPSVENCQQLTCWFPGRPHAQGRLYLTCLGAHPVQTVSSLKALPGGLGGGSYCLRLWLPEVDRQKANQKV